MKILLTFALAGSLFCVSCQDLCAQSGPVASGGQASGAGGTVSFSLGQTDYMTVSGIGGIITQGLQQPYEISVISGKETGIWIYPNPTVDDFVILKIEHPDLLQFSYHLYDLQGRLLKEEKVENRETSIPMMAFASASYLVRVLNSSGEVKTFKIIKK